MSSVVRIQDRTRKAGMVSGDFHAERVDLAAAFRWTARLNMHEAVANHFSMAVNEDGTRFLINPNQRHFSQIRASDLLVLDANDPHTMEREDAPDRTAWGLHGSVHRLCPHVRCAMHVHSIHATVLASLADSYLPPIEQNSAMFFNRHVVDEEFGGIALEAEGERCAVLLSDPKTRIMVMGNHGVMAVGETIAEAFNYLFYFERACEVYIRALQTGKKLRVMDDELAERVAQETQNYPGQCDNHFSEIKAILDAEEPDYRN